MYVIQLAPEDRPNAQILYWWILPLILALKELLALKAFALYLSGLARTEKKTFIWTMLGNTLQSTNNRSLCSFQKFRIFYKAIRRFYFN